MKKGFFFFETILKLVISLVHFKKAKKYGKRLHILSFFEVHSIVRKNTTV